MQRRRAAGAGLCALALVLPAAADGAAAPRGTGGQSGKLPATATLEQCQTSASEDARSATFAGEMGAIAGTERMQMSVQVLERRHDEDSYHLVSAPGLGVWRSSAPGVQSYKYLRQITNLDAPAAYRAAIRFRWLGAHDKTIASLELHTRACLQTAPPAQPEAG